MYYIVECKELGINCKQLQYMMGRWKQTILWLTAELDNYLSKGDVTIFGIKENRSGDNSDKLVHKVIFFLKKEAVKLVFVVIGFN